MRRIFIILVVLVITSLPDTAEAYSCRVPQGKDAIAGYAAIFKGRVLATHRSYFFWKSKGQPDSYTEFEVLEVFKGDIGQRVRVYHSRKQDIEAPPVVFERDAEEVVFAHRLAGDNFYRAYKCGYHIITGNTLRILMKYKDEIQLLNGLRGEYGEDRFFKEKIQLLEKYRDYRELRNTYEAYFKQNYEADLQGMREKHGSKTDEILRQHMKSQIDNSPEVYRPRTGLPNYFKLITIPSGNRPGYGQTMQSLTYLLAYARVLFELREYRDALWFLGILTRGEEPGADFWRLQTLIKLGLTNEFDYTSLRLPHAKLASVDLSGLQLERSDFSQTVIDILNVTDANLTGSDFREAKITSLTAERTVLSGADFSGATIYGDFQNADLSYIKATNAELGGDFRGANLKHADLRGAKLQGGLDGAELTEALYDSTTVWPKGFDPSEAKGIWRNVEEMPKFSSAFEKDKFTELPENTQFYALGIHKGIAAKDGQECGHNKIRPCYIPVKIKKTNVPVFLILSAYEPSVWDVDLVQGAQVVGVLVSGQYNQDVFGVPGSVKVVDYTLHKVQYERTFSLSTGGFTPGIVNMKQVLEELTGTSDAEIIPYKNGMFSIE